MTDQTPTQDQEQDPGRKSGLQENSAGTPQPRPAEPAAEPAKNGEDGHTKVEQDGDTAPRLPHERDQSADSQKHPGGEATEVGKQAFKDTQSEAVDTDRAPVTDKVYNEKLKR